MMKNLKTIFGTIAILGLLSSILKYYPVVLGLEHSRISGFGIEHTEFIALFGLLGYILLKVLLSNKTAEKTSQDKKS